MLAMAVKIRQLMTCVVLLYYILTSYLVRCTSKKELIQGDPPISIDLSDGQLGCGSGYLHGPIYYQ